jgi:hypothetical protein
MPRGGAPRGDSGIGSNFIALVGLFKASFLHNRKCNERRMGEEVR